MIANFAVRIEVETPVSLRGLLHLDGLLGALADRAGGRWDDIPLARYEGLWQGSAAFLETGPFGPVYAHQVRVKRVRADAIPDRIFMGLKPRECTIGAMSPMRNRITPYPCLEGIRAVWFAARGDQSATAELLVGLRNLGAMGRAGYGRVSELHWVELPDRPLTGLMHGVVLPSRAIPLSAWKRMSADTPADAVIFLGRAHPPYWAGPETTCIGPMQIDLMGTASDILQMLVGA
jgi:CRISPR type IV-associated protein Csf3